MSSDTSRLRTFPAHQKKVQPNLGPTVPFWPMALQLAKHRDQYQQAFDAVLDSAWLVNGPQLAAFEQEWASVSGAKYAIGVGSGFDALLLCLKVYGLGPGDRVGVPAHTCPATAMAVLATGATIVPIDVDRQSGNMDLKALEMVLCEQVLQAVIVVNLYGRAADWINILDVLDHYPNIKIIEDNAQGQGVWSDRVPGGQVGSGNYAISATSFYPTKNIGALGEAGAITTSDPALAERLRSLRDYGNGADRFVSTEQGGNYRLDELQAAFLRVTLLGLVEFNQQKIKVTQRLNHALEGLAACYGNTQPDLIQLPLTHDDGNGHLFVIRTTKRAELQQHLTAQGIQTMIHYPCPTHLQPVLAHLGYQAGDFLEAEAWAAECLSLPSHPMLSDQELDRIINGLDSFWAMHSNLLA